MAENGKWQDRVTDVRRMRVGDLLPYKYNPKRHPASQMARIEAVLEKFGKVQGVIAWHSKRNGGKLTTFDGNARRNLDPDEMWLVNVTDLDDAEVDELVFYFDPLAGMSLHDEARMAALMQDLGDVDGVLGELLGELAEGVGLAFGDGDGPEDPGAQIDKAAQLQEVWRVSRGQVWEIPSLSVPGKAHRIMCGDSTDAGDVGRLMRGTKADILIADPPYPGLKGGTTLFSNRGVAKVKNPTVTVGTPWDVSLDWLTTIWKMIEYGALVFCSFHSVDMVKTYHRDAAIALITWYKRNSAPSVNNVPHYQTEFIWVFKKDSGLGWRNLKTLYDIPGLPGGCMGSERIKDSGGKSVHPTQKPIELITELLTVGGDVILDPFCGTGTTGVACEGLGKEAWMIEISPVYCAVSLDRLQRLGLEPRLVEG